MVRTAHPTDTAIPEYKPEVLIPVRQKNPPFGGFDLWLADQDYSRYALALRAAVVTLLRSNSLRSLVEPEVLIPVRQKKPAIWRV